MFLYSEHSENILNPLYQVRDEADIYPIWQNQCGNSFQIPGGTITVIHPGERNVYSGPDFKNCMLLHSRGFVLNGDVEIHTHMEDWNRHHHSHNSEYENVVLHVIIHGIPNHVTITETCSVPTIVLPLTGASYPDSCYYVTDQMGSENIYGWIRAMARIRWEEIQKGLSISHSETLYRFFKIVSIRGNEKSLRELSILFGHLCENKDVTDASMLSVMDHAGKSFAWKLGKRRPASHPKNRIPFVSLLAWTWINNQAAFQGMDIQKMLKLKNQLQRLGYPVPGITFLKEMMGNIVLPLLEIQTREDHFQYWSSLTIQPYAVVRHRLSEWGLTPVLLSFEIQQGVLQIEKESCQQRHCHICPAGVFEYSEEDETDWMINENKNKLIN